MKEMLDTTVLHLGCANVTTMSISTPGSRTYMTPNSSTRGREYHIKLSKTTTTSSAIRTQKTTGIFTTGTEIQASTKTAVPIDLATTHLGSGNCTLKASPTPAAGTTTGGQYLIKSTSRNGSRSNAQKLATITMATTERRTSLRLAKNENVTSYTTAAEPIFKDSTRLSALIQNTRARTSTVLKTSGTMRLTSTTVGTVQLGTAQRVPGELSTSTTQIVSQSRSKIFQDAKDAGAQSI